MDLPKDLDGRLALGKRVHERESGMTVEMMAEQTGYHRAGLFAVLREYRDSVGIQTETQRKVLAAHAAGVHFGKKKVKKANGNGAELTAVAAPHNPMTEARIRDLERELAHWRDEVETLQKILMVVGKAL